MQRRGNSNEEYDKLSRSVMFDVFIEHFILHEQYDIFEHDQPLLGGEEY